MTKRLFLLIVSMAYFFTTEPAHAQNIGGVINSYAKVSSINATVLTIGNVSGSADDFKPGAKILVIQMKGAEVDRTNTSDYGRIVDLKEAGNYEFAIVSSVAVVGASYEITVHHLTRPYDVSGFVQIISVPQYEDITVSADLTASPWSSATGTGGVLVMEVAGTLTLAANIDVSAIGFAGGTTNPTSSGNGTDLTTYVTTNTILGQKGEGIAAFGAEGRYGMGALANGGGGGNTHNAGGGGGGNFSAGGMGGESHYGPGGNGNPGKKIISAPVNNKIFFGGGGGGGQENNGNGSAGGAGGGIIIIRAHKIVSDCGALRSILANGENAANTTGNDGGGGGGAGGSILLDVANFDLSCNINVFTHGGNGGSATTTQKHAGGGGGGAGSVLLPGTVKNPFAIIGSNPGMPGLDCSSACTSVAASGEICAGNACDGDETWPLLANTPPIANDDAIIIAKDAPATIAVLGNDLDADFASVFSIATVSEPANGTLSLSGKDFVYTPDAGFLGNDSFEYQICDNGSPILCNTATVYITVNSVQLSGIGTSPLNFTEAAPAVPIAASMTIGYLLNTTLTGATVEISGNFVDTEDVLTFANANGITGSWDAEAGRLSLSGEASLANYEMAIRSVTYQNTNQDNPSNLSRTISFTAIDGSHNSNTINRLVHVIPVNDAPVLAAIEPSALDYTEEQAATLISGSIVMTDVDHTHLSGATVTIASNYNSAEDILFFANAHGITGSWNPATGTLTLTGNASISDYQTALRAVSYRNSNNNNPSTATRTINFQVNDGSLNSNTLSRNISLTAVNDAPVLAGIEASTLVFVEGDAAKILTGTTTIGDVDDTHITSAVVTITSNYNSAEDVLTFVNSNGIVGNWIPATGALTLSGSATISAYQAALRTITYQNLNNENPFPATRSISIVVNDGVNNSNTLSRNITITPVNDAPVLAGIETTALEFTEGDAAKIISTNISTADVDNANLSNAIIKITTHYLASEDVLAFTNANGISGSWDAATGTLTLSGTASLANYETALQSITYQNTNTDNPSDANRTVSFTISDGALNSNILTRNIEITPVNDAPVLAGIETTALEFTEGDAAKLISTNISTADVDNANLNSAIVKITTNYTSSEDVLAFTNANGISGSWDAATGTLTLSGTASLANYEAALQSITYQNTNTDNPSDATRTVSFTISDGALNSNILTRNIEITPVNDAPVLAGIETTALKFTEGDAAKLISTNISTADVDNANLSNAIIKITTHYLASEDVLAFTNASGINGSWDAATGTLTLSGTASLANYETALQSITYQNTNTDNPSDANRTVSFTISDGALNSNILTRNITITPVNDAPVLAGIETTALEFTEGDPATLVTLDLENGDVDNTTLSGAIIAITANYLETEDVLAFTDYNGIFGNWDAPSGVLTLAGEASVADYQAALRTVTYQNTNNEKPSELSRMMSFVVNDGSLNSNNATREIVIIPVNDAPVTADDVAETDKNVAVSVNVLANDMDVEGDELQVSPTAVIAPAHGTLLLNADQTFTYTPDFNFFGSDSFVYELCDDGDPVACSTATVNITIHYKNYPPVANNDIVDTREDEALVIEVLANDTDPDVDAINVSPDLVDKPKFGKVTLADNKYTYIPHLNYNGYDAFQYQICDNGTPSICVTATVDIYLEPVNDAPEPADDFYKNKDVIAEIEGNVLENDYDIEADHLSVSLSTLVLPRNGELDIEENGDFSYLPDPGFFGEDTFEYFACDDGNPSLCTKATVSLLVSSGVPKGFSPNGDSVNDEWVITGLEEFPMNRVVVLNRYGDTVFEINGYDNGSRVWRGEANRGLKLGGSTLPDGTYFYVIDFGDGKSTEKGFIIIKR